MKILLVFTLAASMTSHFCASKKAVARKNHHGICRHVRFLALADPKKQCQAAPALRRYELIGAIRLMWNQEFVRVLTLDQETVMTRPDSTVVTSIRYWSKVMR